MWKKKLNWLTLHGSEEQRRVDGAHIRRLAAFEKAYGVNLADLLFSEKAKAEHAQLAKEFKAGKLGQPPLNWREN